MLYLLRVVIALTVVISASVNAQLLDKSGQGSTATSADAIKSAETKIINRLRATRSDLNFSDFKESPVAGLYQLKINGQVAYVSVDGEFLIAGEMYQFQGNQLISLQDREREEASIAFEPQRAKMLDAVNRDDMVIFTPKGETKTYVHVFTDIDCGFCRRLHAQIDDFLDKGIEVRYLGFPRAGARSVSAQKLQTVWCAENDNELMNRFKEGQNVKLAPCDTSPVADHYLLGQQVGVTGTPSIILPSGKMVPGAVSADYLASLLDL